MNNSTDFPLPLKPSAIETELGLPNPRPVVDMDAKVTLQCNECGKKRKVSPDRNYNDRCPKCGGVDWDVL